MALAQEASRVYLFPRLVALIETNPLDAGDIDWSGVALSPHV